MTNKFSAYSKVAGFILITALTVSCGDLDSAKDSEEETKVESSISTDEYTPETMRVDIQDMERLLSLSSTPNKAQLRVQLVEFYDSYSKLFPRDTHTADMLFKAGNESVNVVNYDAALLFYDRVDNHYPEYIKRAESIYLQGFIYESYKGEFGKSKEKYERVLKIFPNHILAEQAKQSIANLGLTDEEIIRKFEKDQGVK